MKNKLTTGLFCLFITQDAFAHGATEIYGLVVWFMVLGILLFGYLILGSNTILLRLLVILSSLLTTIIGILATGGIQTERGSFLSISLSVIIGLLPLIGAFLGFKIGRNKL